MLRGDPRIEERAHYIYWRTLRGKPTDRAACLDAARFFIRQAEKAPRPWEAFFALARARWLLHKAGEEMPWGSPEEVQKWFLERFGEGGE